MTKAGLPPRGVVPNLVMVEATSLPPSTVTDAFTEGDCWRAGRPFMIWAVRRRSLQLQYHDGTCMTRYINRTIWRMLWLNNDRRTPADYEDVPTPRIDPIVATRTTPRVPNDSAPLL